MPIIRAADLAYVRVAVSDLDDSEKFFREFGLRTRARDENTLYLAAAGTQHHVVIAHRGEPRLLAIGFEAAAGEDLDRLNAEVAGASPVEATGEPGGGKRVVLHDVDGYQVEVVHGISRCPEARIDFPEFNTVAQPLLRRNAGVPLKHAPSNVQRIGHVVRKTPSVEAQVAWYHETLGLLSSDDVLKADSDELLMSFIRLDRGETYVDHHSLQFIERAEKGVHHISFEVQNLDDLYLGHENLARHGYRPVWGVGRHLQGSAIYDYWLDPNGVMYEHWTDSDRLNADVEPGLVRITDMEGPWGPPMPRAFFEQASV